MTNSERKIKHAQVTFSVETAAGRYPAILAGRRAGTSLSHDKQLPLPHALSHRHPSALSLPGMRHDQGMHGVIPMPVRPGIPVPCHDLPMASSRHIFRHISLFSPKGAAHIPAHMHRNRTDLNSLLCMPAPVRQRLPSNRLGTVCHYSKTSITRYSVLCLPRLLSQSS